MSSRRAARVTGASGCCGSRPRARNSSAISPIARASRFARAYRETGAEAVEGFRKVLLGLLDPAERQVVDKRLRGGGR
jgi:hypothetical protein